MKKLATALGALSLFGCGPTLKFTRTGAELPPKPPDCQIAVYTTTPAQPHQELGTIAIQYGNTGFLEKPEDLMKTIRPEVCKAGGDAAVGVANSYGTYLKATVLSLTPAAPAKTLTTPEDASGSDTKALEGPVEL